MKKNSLLLLSFLLLLFISCKKNDTCPLPTYPISGLWIGTYTAEQVPSQGSLYYSFIIKPDGKVLTESLGGDGKTYYASGTWNLTGSTFIYSITTFESGINQTGSLTFSDQGNLTDGTWQDINNSPNLNGTFPTMTRIN